MRKELITQYVKRGYQCAYRVRNEIRGFAKIWLILNRTNCWHVLSTTKEVGRGRSLVVMCVLSCLE